MIDELRYKRLKLIKDLMKNPAFNEVFHMILQQIAAEMFTTNPEETVKRENLYNEQRAVGRVLGMLQALANEATVEESKVGSNG